MTQRTQTASGITLDRLAARKSIEIAVHTQFHDVHTLTIQLAPRLAPGRLAIQIYRSSAVPPFPPGFDKGAYLPTDIQRYGRYFESLVRRRTTIITPRLSPVRMLADLFELTDVEPISRQEGRQL